MKPQRAIMWIVLGMMSLLLVLPVDYDREDPGWLVRVLLWIDEHWTGGGGGGGQQGEDPPPSHWGGGPSPDWND